MPASQVLKRTISALILFAAIINPSFADNKFVNRPDVQVFIRQMIKKHHFKKEKLISILNSVKLRPLVIQYHNKPLERESWYRYQLLFVTDWHIQNGVKFWNKFATTLKNAEKTFGVPPSIIVATIGIETKYGKHIGDFRVIDSLCSLAFSKTRRSAYFKKELEHFLILTRDNRLNPLLVKGSYAGAIGQPQFMPSSYRYYAVNFSKTGKTDLIHNEIDVIGSIANYYKKHGWTPNQPVAAEALLIGDRYRYLKRTNKILEPLTVSNAIRLGIVPKSAIKPASLKVKVIELQNRYSKEYWLGFHNFDVIRRYNSSDLYAMAVYQLSNHITALKLAPPAPSVVTGKKGKK